MDYKLDFARLGLKPGSSKSNSKQCTCFDFHEVALFCVSAEPKDRRYSLKKYSNSFVGKDTVSRLVNSGMKNRLDAVCICYNMCFKCLFLTYTTYPLSVLHIYIIYIFLC